MFPPFLATRKICYLIFIIGFVCFLITIQLSSLNGYQTFSYSQHALESFSLDQSIENDKDSPPQEYIAKYRPISSYNPKSHHRTNHNQIQNQDQDQTSKSQGSHSTKSPKGPKGLKQFHKPTKNIIFPRTFDEISQEDLTQFYKTAFLLESEDSAAYLNPSSVNVFKYQYNKDLKSEPLSDNIIKLSFHKFTFSLYSNLKRKIGEVLEKCNLIKQEYEIQISDPIPLENRLERIVAEFANSNSPYYEELKVFFEDNPIKKQLKEKTITKHWYRLAGTSVWLEQYGVHFMISRVIYSPKGIKNQPVISLTYAQIFDELWQELDDVELIIPTNNPDLDNNNNLLLDYKTLKYKNMKFPTILPIPFYHDSKIVNEKYYGPEDPRLLITKNELGYEEPLIIFNSWHRKIVNSQSENENDYKINFAYFRSMHMCWPWQFQRGKINIEELPNPEFKLNLYNRVVELKKTEVARDYLQKNWTPFTSYYDRQQYGFDKYIYFIYKWEDLQVLKCKLSNINEIYSSDCVLDYTLNKKDDGHSIGALRGGSQLININSLLDDYQHQIPKLKTIINHLPKGREIWIGFARAHLRNCGCGHDFYRPNIVIIVKDNNNKYKISHISPFVSLDVPVGTFSDITNTKCVDGPNVFIPNGIGSWSLSSTDLEDYLTLIYSIADSTVDIIHIKGLLKSLLLHPDGASLFETSSSKKQGFNNDNIVCALEGSRAFCDQYGKDHAP
ncbi:uncharacterized protein RJT21DRAFT_328 [Scheffersomyces amazonensis]|uniref:uncharacterized protein n=1 Tax=Scheffersomyces amazonensis TaxID=1078765 RepID=UPI00315CB3EC